MNDDFAILGRARDTHPVECLGFLELMLTEPTVWEVFGGFSADDVSFGKILGMAGYITIQNSNKTKVSTRFIARLAKSWMRTNGLSNADKNDVQDYLSAVLDKRNVNRAGRHKFKDLFSAYKAPFSELLPLLSDDIFKENEFVGFIVKKNSVKILEKLVECAFNSDNVDLLRAVYEEISKNTDVGTLQSGFLRDFPAETSLIYHGKCAEAVKSLSKRLDDALNAGTADVAENVLDALLRVALLMDDGDLFIDTRVKRLELFVITERRGKADTEYEALKEFLDDTMLEEIRNVTGYSI